MGSKNKGNNALNINEFKDSIRSKIYLLMILILIIVISIIDIEYLHILIAIYICLLMFEIYVSYLNRKNLNKSLDDIVSNFNIVTKTTMVNAPFPLVIAKSNR